ncbi:MAG: histidinol-phosphate transaminase [Acidimicrobiales bacterium]
MTALPSEAKRGSPPPARPDVAVMAGYHSPQLDVRVRLNTNESPYPPPPGWLEDLGGALAGIDFHRYPDREAGALRQALGALHQVGPESIFCGNGSNEVIECLLLAYGGPGRVAATFEPTYALHSHIARLTSTGLVQGQRSDDYSLDLKEVLGILERDRPDVTFMCSPNNPTGGEDPPEVTTAVLEGTSGLVAVDEAYGQFASWSALSLINKYPNLAVIRTFSKTWAMAGLRIGYLVADPDVISATEKVALPYRLDVLKQQAGLLALKYHPDMEKRAATLRQARDQLYEALGAMDLDVWPSGANFILFRPRPAPAALVWQGLVDRSVLVRDCSSWPRLTGCLRVSVGTSYENAAFLAALEETLN